jgi:hypothetical protein
MGVALRGAASLVALAAYLLLIACGSSVADADAPQATRPTAAPASPFCAAAQASSEAIRPLNVAAGNGAPPENLPNTVDAVRRAGADLLTAAPPEVRPDVERTVQAVNLQLDALLANGGDAAAVARDPDLVARLSSPEFTRASERYRAYVNRNCGPLGSTRGSG